jgi:hypothetical protein
VDKDGPPAWLFDACVFIESHTDTPPGSIDDVAAATVGVTREQLRTGFRWYLGFAPVDLTSGADDRRGRG